MTKYLTKAQTEYIDSLLFIQFKEIRNWDYFLCDTSTSIDFFYRNKSFTYHNSLNDEFYKNGITYTNESCFRHDPYKEPLPNYANSSSGINYDDNIKQELLHARVNIYPENWAKLINKGGEVNTSIMGELFDNWTFTRAWRYWVVKGSGLPFEIAMDLWKRHGKYIRVNGDAGCRSPYLWTKGFPVQLYHVDTLYGLEVISNSIKKHKLAMDEVAKKYGLKEGE